MRYLLNQGRALWVVILACALAIGATPLAAQQESGTALNPVRGIVLNRQTHQPVARALVSTQEAAVLTDNEGRFELKLPAGTARIGIRRPGYGSRNRPSSHVIQVGPNMPDLTFYLTPEAMITGHVTLSTADMADGIRVMAYGQRITNGRAGWMLAGMGLTDSEGEFRIAGLQPGSYLLYTQPVQDHDAIAGRRASDFSRTESYGFPPVYYPGVTDFSAAGILTLTAGQTATADFALTRQPFYSVTVSVPYRQGGGMGFQVHDSSGRTMSFQPRWNPEQGMVQINLPSGSYFLDTRRGGEMPLYGRVDFTVAGAPVSGLTLPLLPLHAIPVTVRKVLTTSSASETSSANDSSSPNAGLNLWLVSADEFTQNGGAGGLRPAESASDGTSFELDRVNPGRYWVQAYAFEGYISSITSGGVDLAREPLVVGAGSASAPIEVTIRDDSGTIAGQIMTGTLAQQPGAENGTALGERRGIIVYAIPLFPTAGNLAQSSVSPDGAQFTMPNLAPGSYRIVAFDSPQEIDFHTPEGLAKYTGKGQTVTVEAGGTANAQIEVIRTDDDTGDEP